MRLSLLRSVLTCCAVVLVTSPVFGATDCEKLLVPDEETLLKQARTPFAEKFSKISEGKSVRALSDENLSRLRAITEVKLPTYSKTFEEFEIVSQIRGGLPTANKILESGQFSSLDELVRKGAVLPNAKLSADTQVMIDGAIGEQDAVFFSIRERGGTRQTNKFGLVEFKFDPSLMDHGYFSFSAFGQGSPQYFASDLMGRAVPFYRRQVFSGRKAFSELLGIMQAQRTKTRAALQAEHLTSEVMEDHRKFCRTSAGHADPICGIAFFKNFIARLGLPVTDEMEKTWDASFTHNFLGGKPEDVPLSSYLDQLLEQYRFVDAGPSTSYLLSRYYGFWELKVPERLETSYITGANVEKTEVTSDASKSDLLEFERQLAALARKRGGKLVKRETSEKYIYEIVEGELGRSSP